jgi:hypothetical protein
VFKRSLTHQWFNNWSLTEPELKQHLQVQGLRETSVFLHDLLRKEVEEVGSGSVVLMGLSQGCAASIVATLLWRGEAFGALVGMCGYLPFRKGMQDCVEEAEIEHCNLMGSEEGEEEDDDIFARDYEEPEHQTKFEKAVEWLREELQTSENSGEKATEPRPVQSIPVFMAHETED